MFAAINAFAFGSDAAPALPAPVDPVGNGAEDIEAYPVAYPEEHQETDHRKSADKSTNDCASPPSGSKGTGVTVADIDGSPLSPSSTSSTDIAEDQSHSRESSKRVYDEVAEFLAKKKPTVRFPVQVAEEDSDPDLESAARPALTQWRRSFSPRSERSKSRLDSDMSIHTDIEDLELGIERFSRCRCKLNCFSGEGFCHCFYLLMFVMFILFVPLFLRWMVSAPKPSEFWYPKPAFPHPFPLLSNWQFVQEQRGNSFGVWMSPIPTTPSGCRFSTCADGTDNEQSLRASTEMNFEVRLKLDAPQFNHTAYPVLLASDDFMNWNVVADRRHAYPRQYFVSHSEQYGHVYSAVTEQCTRPPELLPGMPAPAIERFSEVPTYVLVCVTWSVAKVELHRRNDFIEGADLAKYCDAIGGVCGMVGDSATSNINMPGCSNKGLLEVDNDAGKVAGVSVPGATFSGVVSLRACMPDSSSSGKCTTTSEPFSRWPTHKCHNATDNMTLLYDSLPPMEVSLRNASIDRTAPGTMAPQAFIFTSPLADNGMDVEGFQTAAGGAFKSLYDYDFYPLPIPMKELPDPGTTTSPPSAIFNASRHTMHYAEQNKLTIIPDWCFDKRGPLYLVACVVNTSTHVDGFEFAPGQKVGKPPFNDRCLAVTGRCASACSPEQQKIQYCEADGTITPSELVGNTETKFNDEFQVYLFVWTLLLGFAVKVWYYVPGIFTPYKRAEFYSPKMTEQIKYLAVCAPSTSESKACVLRNLVGAMSTLPTDCQCPFHVVFADEGHRHTHKIMFRAFVNVMAHIPDVCVNSEKKSKRVRHGFKERNLKTFMACWVDATKKVRLEDCDTEDMVKTIRDLEETGAAGNEDKVKLIAIKERVDKINARIDLVSGIAVLKTMQARHGWAKASKGVPGTPERCVYDLEHALLQLRKELTCGEDVFDGTGICTRARDSLATPEYLDDYEDYGWIDPEAVEDPKPIYNLHYVARAKPREDERKLKVQHVAQGVWCYSVPKKEEARNKKGWLEWRQNAEEFFPGEEILNQNRFLVPLRTSRGKAGGLNFAENYLFDFHRRYEDSVAADVHCKHAIFSIADARHQYQPDFFIETLPYFFRKDEQLNPKVAFTQCPQYFQEMPDDTDYLDTNNSSFQKMGCMLRNCCGGVTSSGTNGTWLIRDRRAGKRGSSSIWELDSEKEMDQGFTQVFERRFFQESCKVENTASSLDRVIKGKYSQYINMRLSYGMAKAPTEYLAAIQRGAEGGVVLMWKTFLGSERGTYMIWMTFLLLLAFITSIFGVVHGQGRPIVLASLLRAVTGDDSLIAHIEDAAGSWSEAVVPLLNQPVTSISAYREMCFQVLCWAIGLTLSIMAISLITCISFFIHLRNFCCCRNRAARRTRFPTCLAQWARLMITVDNLTQHFWCWIAFYWVIFNFYAIWTVKTYNFNPSIMSGCSWLLAIFNYGLLISSSSRHKLAESTAANEVFALSLTNIWRSTQRFYITAPLTVYSIIVGTLDFTRHRMFGEDISYWGGGERGAVSKSIVRWWTLFLVVGSISSWVSFLAGWLPSDSACNFGSLLIVSFIGLDVIHPCAYLWLGSHSEPLPKPDSVAATGLSGMIQRWCRRSVQLLFSTSFFRNCLRSFIFSPYFTGGVKWLGPMNHCLVQPILTLFFPILGVNTALMLLSTK
jgi:hypothetical protein